MTLGDVVNKLHNNDGLADTSTSEETNLTSLAVGENEINDLDTGGEDGILGSLIGELGGDGVDGHAHLLSDVATLIDGITEDVEDTSEGLATDGDGNLATSGDDLGLELKEIGSLHSNAAAGVGIQVLNDLEGERLVTAKVLNDVQGGEDRGDTLGEVDIDDGSDNLGDVTDTAGVLSGGAGGGGADASGANSGGVDAAKHY